MTTYFSIRFSILLTSLVICNSYRIHSTFVNSVRWLTLLSAYNSNDNNLDYPKEPMFSISYDPLEFPTQKTLERDLEDVLRQRSMRFYDHKLVRFQEKCYLVGLEDKSLEDSILSNPLKFTLEESLTELSELAGVAGLSVIGSTYQRVAKPSADFYIGAGKAKEIMKAMHRLKCTCVIFDTELTPSQQKNLEISFNEDVSTSDKAKNKNVIKVIDRTALILDIFAQHAKTREGQLQVQLALLTYRLPRLTNMWTHLERQTSASRGKSNGGVGLRGPGEKQLESDKRQMKSKISSLNKAIDSVREHRSMHRRRRRQLGVPVIALVGYTNSGKSTLLNAFTKGGVLTADILFATLDPTTRMIQLPSGQKTPDILLTDTVGFIQKLPTNLIAAFRATLEEISEADILLHVTDISNPAWLKQEASVLATLQSMGLSDKPVITLWNKIDRLDAEERKVVMTEFLQGREGSTVPLSAAKGEGFEELVVAIESAISSKMEDLSCRIPYHQAGVLDVIHRLGLCHSVKFEDEFIAVTARVPRFLLLQLQQMSQEDYDDDDEDAEYSLAKDYSEATGGRSKQRIIILEGSLKDPSSKDNEIDWKDIAKGRHKITKENKQSLQ